jgi:RsiW-degrading membrane proteinase PrsW (M82 family)
MSRNHTKSKMKKFINKHPGAAVFVVLLTILLGIIVVYKYLSNELWTMDTWIVIGTMVFGIVFLIVIKHYDIENL